MAIGSGLGGSFGIGVQSSYETYATINRWREVESVSLKKNKRIVQGGGLSGGTIVDRGSRRVEPLFDANGTVTMEVTQNRFGVLLSQITGTNENAVQVGATAAYAQNYALADNVGKYFSAQVGVPTLTGAANPYTYIGCKVVSSTFSCDNGGLLMCALDLDARQVIESQALVTPAYTPAQTPFHFGQFSVAIGPVSGTPTPSPNAAVKGFTLKIDRPHAVERFYAGNGGLKAEPVTNGKVSVTGTLEVDYLEKSVFADKYAADTPFSMSLTFSGAAIPSSASVSYLQISLPMVFLDTDTPTLEGPDVVSQSLNFTALFDGTSPAVTFGYMSSDTAA